MTGRHVAEKDWGLIIGRAAEDTFISIIWLALWAMVGWQALGGILLLLEWLGG